MDIRNVCLLFGLMSFVRAGKSLTEEKLHNHLLFEYNKEVIPNENRETPVDVSVGIYLRAIVSFVDNVLTLDTWFNLRWKDIRLAWDPEDYNGINATRMPQERLWIPDITLYNRELTYHGPVLRGQSVVVRSDSAMDIYLPTRFSTYCKTDDTTNIGSDGQFICNLNFGSWVYDGFKIDVYNSSSEVLLSEYYSSNIWDLTNTSLNRKVVRYACCPEPYPSVTATFQMKRRYYDP